MGDNDQDATLDQLFPTLAPALHAMEGLGGNDALRSDPDHHGVTDSDIEAYFQTRLNGPGRTLPPVVPGQVPVGPTFRSGTTGAPPRGGMEDGPSQDVPATPPRQGNQPPDPSPPVQPAEMPQPFQTDGEEGDDGEPQHDNDPESQGGQEAQSVTEGEPSGSVTPPATVDIGGGRVVPIELIRAYDEFNERLAADPNLRQIIQEYVTTGRVTASAPGQRGPEEGVGTGPTTQIPSSTSQSPFDNPPAEYSDDPAFMALWEANKRAYEAQQAQLAQVSTFQQQQYDQWAQEQQRRNQAAADAGVQRFTTSRPTLTAEEVANLRGVAVRLNVIPTLASGTDPITGAPFNPDPVSVVERAMEIAYNTLPQYRNAEVTNATEAAQQRATQDKARKKKAGSLSGSSGSVPRSTPAPTTPEGSRQAMLAEVGAMMNGSWEGGNQ